MLLLQKTSASQKVAIPNETAETGTPTSLHIKGTVSNKEYDIEVSFLETSENGRYFFLDVALPVGMPEGSYEYALKAGDAILSSGCARIGDYSTKDVQYDKSIEYKQYGE